MGCSALVVLLAPGRAGVPRADARSPAIVPVGPALRSTPAWFQAPIATVTLEPGSRTIPVPGSYLGLSAEYWALPRYELWPGTFARVLSLLRVRGGGPLVLRIGGDSADHTYWDPRALKLPAGSFALTPRWFTRLAEVVRSEPLRLILDLNLVADSPSMAAMWAHAALAALPPRSVLGFEVGNEPDLYHRSLWYRAVTAARAALTVIARRTASAALSTGGQAGGSYSAPNYAAGFRSYARALGGVGPHLPLLGPAIANPQLDFQWLARLISTQREDVGIATAHRYPLSACAAPGAPGYPTIARLLGAQASAGLAGTVRGAVQLAQQAGLRFRLTELNSVTCGGVADVSDTFATALWAPDALFEMLRAGVSGVNIHVRAGTVNAPFALTRVGFQARPLMYGMIMFARTLGPGARLVPLRVAARPGAPLKVWAVRVSGALHVLVIDKGPNAARIELHVPGRPGATVQRLLAPSVSASSGVTLAGQSLSDRATWTGGGSAEQIEAHHGRYALTLPSFSAALVSVPN